MLPLIWAAAQAAPDSMQRVWSAQEHGAIRLFGSPSMACSLADEHCLQAQAGSPGLDPRWYDNDSYDMQWIDRDADDVTVNSTAALVRIPQDATVLKAELVWGGTTGGDLDRTQIRFRAPGSDDYRTLTSEASTVRDTAYQSSIDVTDQVAKAGSGTYWGADVSSTPGPGAYAGWALAVAYRDPNQPRRQLTMSVGLDEVTKDQPASLALDHLRTPSTGEVSASVGVVAWDGDRGVTGDRLRLSGTTLGARPHVPANVASSSVQTPATLARPRLAAARANTMGLDIATLDATGVLDNGASRAMLRASTRQDDFGLGLVTTQVDLDAPDPAADVASKALTPDPASTDVGVTMTGPSAAAPGDLVAYPIHLTNAGPADTVGLAFDVSAPAAGTSYTVTGTGVTCDVVWHCTVATPLSSGQSLDATLRVQTDSSSTDGDEVAPQVTATTTSIDPNAANNIDGVTTTLSTMSTLTLTSKIVSGTVLPGGQVTYQITMKNTGPAAAVNPAIVVGSPPDVTLVSATGTSGALCGKYSGKPYCGWASVPAGQTRVMTYKVHVTDHAPEGAVLRMVAVAAADNSTAPVTAHADKVVSDTNTRPTDVAVTLNVTKMKAGEHATWTTSVTNHGPHRAHDVRVTLVPPAGMEVVPLASASRWQRSTTTFSLGDVEVGQTKLVKVTFRVPVIGSRSMAFGANTDHTDPDAKAANDAVSVTHQVSGHMMTFVQPASSSSSTTPVVQSTTDPNASTSTSTTEAKTLAETGGPQRQTLLLGVVLMLLGAVATTASRRRRTEPRHHDG